jgi:DNA polymerase
MRGDILYCRLLSGRCIVYHKPRLRPSDRKQDTFSLSYEGWNTNPKYGKYGWVRMDTYGGKLCENIIQGVARDILAHAIVNLERANYRVVLHVHDEIVCEIPELFGSIDEFESIMSILPAWAADWPIKAQGGWRAKRYTK